MADAPNRYIIIPDPQHQYLCTLHRDAAQLHTILLDAYQRQCIDGWASGPDDGYFFQRLPYHLLAVKRQYEAQMLLFNCEWLSAKLKAAGVQALIDDCVLLRQVDVVRRLERALRQRPLRSAMMPTMMASQLVGRLLDETSSEVKILLAMIDATQDRPWLRPLGASLCEPSSLVQTFSGYPAVTAIAMMPTEESVIAGLDDGLLIMWNWHTGDEQYRIVGHATAITALAVTTDGQQLISGANDGTFKVWDLEKRILRWRSAALEDAEEKEEATTTSVVLMPDNLHLVVSFGDESISVWNLVDQSEVYALSGHTSPVTTLAVTPNGKYIVSGSQNGMIGIWDTATRTGVAMFKGRAAPVSALVVDNRCIVTGGVDGTITSWDLASQAEILTIQGHLAEVSALAISADGQKLVSASFDTTLAIWDLIRGVRLHTLAHHTESVTAMLLTADGRHAISASWDTTLRVWDLENEEAIPTGHAWPINALALSADGRQALSHSVNGMCAIWDVASSAELSTTPGWVRNNAIATFLADGSRLVVALSSGGLAVCDTGDGTQTMILAGNGQPVSTLAATRDGRFVAAGLPDGTVEVWNLSTGELIWSGSMKGGTVTALALTDEYVFASFHDGKNGSLAAWEMKSALQVAARKVYGRRVTALAAAHDGQRMVSGSDDGTIEVWDLTSKDPLHRLDGHQDQVQATVVMSEGSTRCFCRSGLHSACMEPSHW